MSVLVTQDQSGLAPAISNIGNTLAQVLGQRAQEKRMQSQQKEYGTILQSTLGQLDETASPIQITQALTSAIQQGVPVDIAQNFGTLMNTLSKSRGPNGPSPDQINQMSKLFEKFGMPAETAQRNAELWGNLTTGGQTEMAKLLVDQIARNQFEPASQSTDFTRLDTNNRTLDVSETVVDQVETFKWPKVDIFEDRTPKERIQLKGQLLKENNQYLKSLNDQVDKKDDEIRRYDQLERLNESGKLPEGALGRLNVNWTTGDLRIPALANPETQLYVKSINDFTTAAKDTYGARVTNFSLGAFMKRLPTLANSKEGRKLIIEQMKTLSYLTRLKDESIKKVYEKYGNQKIDISTAERIARQLRSDDEKELKKKYENVLQRQQGFELRQKAPPNTLPVKKPDGTIGYLPYDKVDDAKARGWEIL